jgi:hypothetical protein|tara:strand:- start:174 stop:1109 length:936 start_codon:yes stop_codon:yes gene_type:complete
VSKDTALEFTNNILALVGGTQVSTIVGLTGGTIADITLRTINRAIKRIAGKPDVEWFTLFKSRLLQTRIYTASTITIAQDSGGDTITDSASGLGSFDAGAELVILDDSNDNLRFTISSVAAGQIVLNEAEIATAVAIGSSISVVQVSYPVASDFRNSIDLLDPANNTIIKPRYTKSIDMERRWANNATGDPDLFTVAGNFYRLSWIPGSQLTLIDRYMAYPTELTLDAQTSDLPEFCDNAIHYLAYSDILFFKKNLEQGAAEFSKYKGEIEQAIDANQRISDMENVVEMNSDRLMGSPSVSSNSLLTIVDD